MAASIETLVDRVLKDFNSETTKPEQFLSIQDAASQKFKAITKELFDFGNKNFPIKGLSGGLAELFIEGFDEEQIWQQIELHNDPAFNRLMKNVSKVLAIKDKNLTFKQLPKETSAAEEDDGNDVEDKEKDDDSIASELSIDIPQESEDEDDEDGSDFDDDDNEDDLKLDEYKVLDEEREERPGKEKRPQKVRKTEVDDKFFKLGEMEKFLEKEEAENPIIPDEDDDDEDVDYFDYIPSDDEDNEEAVKAKYKDFFRGPAPEKDTTELESEKEEELEGEEGDENDEDGEMDEELDEEDEDLDDIEPRGKKVKFDFDADSESDEFDYDDDDSDTGDKGVKSSFEQRQERLRAKIKEMEEEALAPKPWQLMGETKAELRPENALLEEDLVFDHTTRHAPVITEETTRTLEDIIKQRIKDQAFDDVERKVKPVYDPTEYKKKLVLDQEKSKFSLAEIYEQEYLKQQELQQQASEAKASSLADPIAEKQSDNAEHAKISKLMKDLFGKLDALCNFHYTPRTPAPEIKIVSNMPSIAMEEIAPVAVSDANLLAPEEVQDHMRGELKGDGEKDKTDRLRERRKKKAAQRTRHREKERAAKAVDKANPGLGNKHAKIQALQRLQKAEKEGAVSIIKDGDRQKAPKSSSAFFKQLQEDVAAGVEAVKREKTKAKAKRTTGSQLKL